MADLGNAEDAVFRIFIKADIQCVWRELTKQGDAQGAVFDASLHSTGVLGAGVPMEMRTGSGTDVIVDGTVEVFEPPHRFVCKHRFTHYDDPICRVSYEMKAVGDHVEVTLRVLGMPSRTPTAMSMAGGSTRMLTALKALCETDWPPLATRWLYEQFNHTEFVLPARTKCEQWPLKGR